VKNAENLIGDNALVVALHGTLAAARIAASSGSIVNDMA